MRFLPSLLLLLLLLMAGCGQRKDSKDPYDPTGVWTLSSVKYCTEEVTTYPVHGRTYCRIFNADSTFCECLVMNTPSGVVIAPNDKGSFEFIDKGDEVLYFENGALRPFHRENDTTLVIQKYGAQYIWVRNYSMSESRQQEIRSIVENYDFDADDGVLRYVLSTTERELKSTNHLLTGLLTAAVAIIAFALFYVWRLFLRKRHIEHQLSQITEEQALRPRLIQDAQRQVEEEFFSSDYFSALHNRVAAGEMLRPADWEEIEREMKPVYPDLFRRLPGLCRMSVVEYRTCLLIKLRFSPSEMAGVLCKDISTVSSIRSRLYKKVFGRSGGAKGWDEFIISL